MHRVDKLTISNRVKHIDGFAFDGCTALTNATYKGETYSYSTIRKLYNAAEGIELGII